MRGKKGEGRSAPEWLARAQRWETGGAVAGDAVDHGLLFVVGLDPTRTDLIVLRHGAAGLDRRHLRLLKNVIWAKHQIPNTKHQTPSTN